MTFALGTGAWWFRIFLGFPMMFGYYIESFDDFKKTYYEMVNWMFFVPHMIIAWHL
eukprot:CAMPEP_0114603292 /NCGR_PEP_ID=MMETSP0125-20121206/25735_1 /TAXON_ID=485358 ORGANISM="Aristerostoma sp., Strain ATCC 50986" /NCGR_SAMPLE_ID=MMETSP0125 /ASSEMBLY_ACC=CAM_ASM_000245 /LENGTH=55 /DNA_ID=CAMNT_0001814023 /DNA_START=368 /DNA_END=535 /DNA_ORIENTATION=+